MQTTDPRAALIAQLDAARPTTGKKVKAATILELLISDRLARFVFWVAIDLVLFLQAQGIEVERRASDNRISAVLARLLAAEDAAREAVRGRPWTERESTVYLLARILGEQPAESEVAQAEGRWNEQVPPRFRRPWSERERERYLASAEVVAEVRPVAAD